MAALEFLKNRIVILMQERDKAINRADELQDTVQNAKDLVTKLETDKRDLENRLELADAEIDKLHEWKEQVEVEKLRRENDSLQNAIDTFEVAFEYKDQEIGELEKQIEEFNQEMDDLAS
ncbi:hypothetical protein ACHWQZ_G006412 [Mnemiopsis leidyi]